GLVLGGVRRRAQLPPSVIVPFDPGVVSGGQVVRPQATGLVQQRPKLEVTVAGDTRVRGAAGVILPAEVADHPVLKLRTEIQDVVGDAQLPGYPPGIVDGRQPTATAVAAGA